MNALTYLDEIKGKKSFTRKEALQSFRNGGYTLSDASFNKTFTMMVKEGTLLHAGFGKYYIPGRNTKPYKYNYSALAKEAAEQIQKEYPLVRFMIMDLVQMNDFVNHQIAHNTIFVSVETDAIDFVFETLKDKYFGRTLLLPTSDLYNQYWCENMIVVNKLTTEAPKCTEALWHTRLEKLLVDIMADPVLREIISESEYPYIYENAFSMYEIDESSLFRYASRRTVKKKIEKLISEQTNIQLRIKG